MVRTANTVSVSTITIEIVKVSPFRFCLLKASGQTTWSRIMIQASKDIKKLQIHRIVHCKKNHIVIKMRLYNSKVI